MSSTQPIFQLVPSLYTGTEFAPLPEIVAPKFPVTTKLASVTNDLAPAPAVEAEPNPENVVEEVKGVASNTSTIPPSVGDIIPGNDDGNDIDFLIKPEIQLSIEEKIELNKTKSSIKEEEFDIFQRNIEDAFSEDELNAFSI